MAGKKVVVTLSDKTYEMLVDLCEQKGLTKSAVVALAIAELKREEEGRSTK